MARCRQPITWLVPGTVASLFIVVTVFAALITLWAFAIKHGESDIAISHYLLRVLTFTFWQATLSTLISVCAAMLLAKAISQQHFYGKRVLLRLLSVTFVLPSLVVVTGLIAVYGLNGWLANLCHYLAIDYDFSIYGLSGILIAHIFLNFPFASRLCYQALMLIPAEQKQLAHQLGMNEWQVFRYLELPVLLRQMLPICGLIFMLCFSSFATVLALSGSPKYTTIEVAIYQAIRDFELHQAVILSIIQLVLCIGFLLILKAITPKQSARLFSKMQQYVLPTSTLTQYLAIGVITISAIFIISPLAAIVIDGIHFFSMAFLSASFYQAFMTSIIIAISSAILAMSLAVALLWTNSRLQLFEKTQASTLLMLIGSIILAIPSMVLAAGFFLLFYAYTDIMGVVPLLVIISNSFLALPFILKNLESPMTDLTKQYYLLSQTLNVRGLNYLRLIEFKALKKLFAYSFAFACIMSMGDFGIVALFGDQHFMTLPYYLYEQIAHYRQGEAAFSALVLLLISISLITLFDYSNTDNTLNTKSNNTNHD